jgi:hypothetical protein
MIATPARPGTNGKPEGHNFSVVVVTSDNVGLAG